MDDHIDYEVQLLFYDKMSGSNYEFPEDIMNSPGEYSILELMSIDDCIPAPFVRTELDFYTPPWISQDLLDYSLRGLEAIKV